MLRPDPRRLLAAAVLAAAGGLLAAAPATAGAAATGQEGGIDIVQVGGLVDPMNAELVEGAVADAEARGSTLLVFQLDSGGALDVDVERLTDTLLEADVPVAVWVGSSDAGAGGAAALLGFASGYLSVANGAGIGPVDPVRLDEPGATSPEEAAVWVRDLQEARGRSTEGVDAVIDRRIGADDALELGLIDSVQPTVGELLVSLDGETLQTASGPVTLDTAKVVGEGADRKRQPNQEVRFSELALGAQVQHALATPWLAYFLFVVGLSLVVFEFFTISIGIAGALGALTLVGAGYGFSHLPVEWWALLLLLVGVLGFSVDLQAGGLGFWTVVGAIALVAGSIGLYGGSSRLDVAWWTIVLVCGGVAVFFVGGMTAMVRSRFSTPTIGREDLVGEFGTAEVPVDPDGVVKVRDALWRARTNRATPIGAGDRVRVVSVEGVVLEVEPEEGGARDYRDGHRRSG